MIRNFVLVALIGAVSAGCTVRSERVVEKPVPATTTTQRTTTVPSDPYTPGTTTTTTYTTPAR